MNESERPIPENNEPQNTGSDQVTPPTLPMGQDAPTPAPEPPAPCGQPVIPQQPTSPYGAPQPYASPYGQAAPQAPYGYNPQPQQPPAPYGQPGTYYQSANGQQPPIPPYPVQPPYPGEGMPQQPKKKVWPWVLGGCLVFVVLLIFGFVGCVSCAILADDSYQSARSGGYSDDYGYSDNYGYGYGYGYNDSGSNSDDSTSDTNVYTLSDLKKAAEDEPSKVENGRCTAGLFEVGAGKDIKPGMYFLEGSTEEQGSYFVFKHDSSTDTYTPTASVIYFGSYFAEFESDDVVVFLPMSDSARMYSADQATFKPEAPYTGGVYRVGIDIPAGTYTIAVNEASVASASADSAAFVMKDLLFNADSITQTKYVIAGGQQTVTVKDGDYLELYAAIATPAE